MRTVYITDDGTQFDNEYACEAYEFGLTISDNNLKIYDAGSSLLDFELTDSRLYNLADKVVVPDEKSLNVLHKIADYCGWCEFNRIDSIGTWIWKDTTPDSYCANEHFVKED